MQTSSLFSLVDTLRGVDPSVRDMLLEKRVPIDVFGQIDVDAMAVEAEEAEEAKEAEELDDDFASILKLNADKLAKTLEQEAEASQAEALKNPFKAAVATTKTAVKASKRRSWKKKAPVLKKKGFNAFVVRKELSTPLRLRLARIRTTAQNTAHVAQCRHVVKIITDAIKVAKTRTFVTDVEFKAFIIDVFESSTAFVLGPKVVSQMVRDLVQGILRGNQDLFRNMKMVDGGVNLKKLTQAIVEL